MTRAVSAVLAAAWALGACGPAPPPPLKIAVIAPLSGVLGSEGEGLRRAVVVAVEEAREKGELDRPVEVVALDDRADPEAATQAARRAAADPAVFAVIGPMTSGCAIPAAQVLALAPLAMLTPSATAAEITQQQERPDWPGKRVAFRMVPSDAIQGDFDAAYAAQRLSVRRAAVIYDPTPYGTGLADSFRQGFEKRGGAIVSYSALEKGLGAPGAAADRLAPQRVDAVFFAGLYYDSGPLLARLRAAGYKGVFMSGDGAKSLDLFQYAGDGADGAYVSQSGLPAELLPGAAAFVERYGKRWGGAVPRSMDHYAYEAARIVLWSMKKTRGDRAAAIEAIRHESHEAIMGEFVFDDKGDSLKTQITMMRANARTRRFEPAY
jgi:branched-chain amino acid transport system substrate-binding protein